MQRYNHIYERYICSLLRHLELHENAAFERSQLWSQLSDIMLYLIQS